MPVKPATTQRGFTLIEIIIAIAIFGILTAIAVPSFNVWQRNAQVRSDARLVLGALQQARVDAITRNVPVTIEFDSIAGEWVTSVGRVGELRHTTFSAIQFDGNEVTFSNRGFTDFFPGNEKTISVTNAAGPPRTVVLKAIGHASIQ